MNESPGGPTGEPDESRPQPGPLAQEIIDRIRRAAETPVVPDALTGAYGTEPIPPANIPAILATLGRALGVHRDALVLIATEIDNLKA
jgi:hypothetical protein